ncbi:MAG: Hsp20/alpha crystallin family protein [Bacteroidota bacterium]
MMLISRKSTPTVPRFFDDFFTKDLFDWGTHNYSTTNSTIPAVNILENNTDFLVQMAAPGMDKKDFTIELDNETLTIASNKEMKKNDKSEHRFTRQEFSYQSFRRTFHLPKTVVDESKIQAQYKNGLLEVLIPKREEAKALPPRTITIK